MSRNDDPRPLWTQVRIHLNLWDVPAATETACQAISAEPPRQHSRYRGASITSCPQIPPGWCFLHRPSGTAVLNEAVLLAHASIHVSRFCVQALGHGPSTFVRYDVDSWALLDELDALEGPWPSLREITDSFGSA